MAADQWLNLQRKVKGFECPLTCPLCQFGFTYLDYFQEAQTCPRCKAPVGFLFYYRLILFIASLLVGGWTMYKGYQNLGPGWLLPGLLVALLFATFAKQVILRFFPPKLEAHAEGSIWLKLK